MRPERPKCSSPGCEAASTRFYGEDRSGPPGDLHGRCQAHAWSVWMIQLGLREIPWEEYVAAEVHGS